MSNFKAERETMIESQIRPNAVTDVALLRALSETPREAFVPPSLRNLAYMDGDLRVEAARDKQPARYLLSPMVFAKLAQLARITSKDRVLDIGSATGYSTAVFAQLAKEVVAVECDAGLAAIARDSLSANGCDNVDILVGPLQDGAPDKGLFNVIFFNGRMETVPDALIEQLDAGGRMVLVQGSDSAPKARIFTKIEDKLQAQQGFDAGAPLLPGFEVKKKFMF